MSKAEINNFYKQIDLIDSEGNGYKHTLFDYEKIWDDEAPIFLIISERGAKAKSTQGKYLARTIWNNHKLKTMWLMNTRVLIENEKKSHLSKPKQFLSDTFNVESRVSGDVVYDDIINQNKDNWYTRFTSLSTAENEKGSRDDYGLVIYDEFNVGLGLIRNSQVDLLSSLIGTLTDPVNTAKDQFKKFIIHGNFKSLNNQFLIDLGVTKIEDEVTDIYIGDFLLMRILAPMMTDSDKKEIADRNKNDWKFLFQEKIGKSNHVYYNENLFDNINNVNDWMITLPTKRYYMVKIGKYYYQVRLATSGDLGAVVYIVQDVKPKKGNMVIALNRIDVEEGVILNTNLKQGLFRLLVDNKLYFKSAYVRENIVNCLRK